ncbi:transcriptional regulator [Bryobacterales bacterium F-183]|nr:transcriptional regulator [Bryobacterales bacterium F-183]
MVEPWLDPVLGPCACSQIRKTARAVSALYDGFLAKAGLTVTQYAILVNIARRKDESLSRTSLAALLGMDRTTLTRNLRPLERDKLVEPMPSDDRRTSLIRLTPAGTKRLAKAFRQWEKVQRDFQQKFGATRLNDLAKLLQSASETAAHLRASDSQDA